MKMSLSRKWLAPALLAIAVAPLALSATAAHHGKGEGGWSEKHQQWQEARAEHRQALFERAGLEEATREALNEAHRQHREAMRELHEQHRERLAEILDDDQRAALEEARGEMRREHRAEMLEQRRSAMQERLEALVDDWDLSYEEREALHETRQAIYTDMSELRERDFDSREARRDAMREMRDEHQAALAEVLSAEQLEEMQTTIQRSDYRGHGKHHGRYANPRQVETPGQ